MGTLCIITFFIILFTPLILKKIAEHIQKGIDRSVEKHQSSFGCIGAIFEIIESIIDAIF